MMVVYSKSTKARGVCGATRWRWIEADTAGAMNVGETSVDRELTAGYLSPDVMPVNTVCLAPGVQTIQDQWEDSAG
jgi:hypothetical protein